MKICCIKECQNSVVAGSLCELHYRRVKAFGDPLVNIRRQTTTCKVEGCGKKSHAKSYCRSHYSSMTNYGREFLVNKTYRQGFVRSDGYKEISVNGERKLEHVYLAEKALGRKLQGQEEIHHMNEDRADNYTPFNLIICPDRAYHKLLHKRMEELGYTNNKNPQKIESLEDIGL